MVSKKRPDYVQNGAGLSSEKADENHVVIPLESKVTATVTVEDEVSPSRLKKAIGKRVEVLAFGISYVGKLTKLDAKNGLIRIEDKDDYVVLEIERVEDFKVLRR